MNVLILSATILLLTQPPDAQQLGRQCTADFYEGRVEQVWERFGPAMKSALGSADKLKAFREQVTGQLGEESAVESETVTASGPVQTYVRVARFSRFPEPIEIVWSFGDAGSVEGFYIRPQQKPAESKHLEYQTKTDLRLPFKERWHVFWGGRTLAQNYHAVAPDQRFAYDLIIMKDGSSHAGDGQSNEQYHCFGQPIFSPGAGRVAAAVDGIADNKPGQMNPQQPLGNHVIIDHGNGEFSFIAHLRQGSVKVQPGQAIERGDLLGLCGNSGNSSEPHLHYHLQTTTDFGRGEGLPAQFREYVADGKPVDRGEPTKGQAIEPAPATP